MIAKFYFLNMYSLCACFLKGMNYIVAILLLVFPDDCFDAEERVFWLLDAL